MFPKRELMVIVLGNNKNSWHIDRSETYFFGMSIKNGIKTFQVRIVLIILKPKAGKIRAKTQHRSNARTSARV